jgi:uroporphyrinogen decarboxylase
LNGDIFMNKVVRVITALKGGIPDMVPFMFNTVMVNVQEGIVGHEIHEPTYN